MMYSLKLNDRASKAIKENRKRVEIRCKKDNDGFSYDDLNNGDVIKFSSESYGNFYTLVKEVNHYNSIEELLTLEGTKYTTSSTDDFDEAVKSINSLNMYKENIPKYGVYAIHIKYLYNENNVWDELFEIANNVRCDHELSGLVSAGGVGAAILTSNHKIFTGVCIDTASSLGMCAERNAIANMITNKEYEITKLVCVDSKGQVTTPCGACRELMMQLNKTGKDIEVLLDIDNKKIVKLSDLTPNWWATNRL